MADTPAIIGGCYCGQVRYQSKEPAHGMTLCYCSICRSLHGAPFAPFTHLSRQHLQWTRSDGLLSLAVSDVAVRSVCRSCYAPIAMVYNADPDEIAVVATSIDEELSAARVPEVESHIYVGEKLGWFKILDDKPQMDGPSAQIQRNMENGARGQEMDVKQIVRRV
ncbi:hypothetical protein PHISP_04364 [Aspergillus sp. HF37]|nr:hypothetical protein PHISP_04364 [Aspergillus sp. HF37]